MLEILGGLFSFFLDPAPKVEYLQTTNWKPWLDESWVQALAAPSPDPVAETAVKQHLGALVAAGFSSSDQSVWLQTGQQVLAEHQATVPLPAASLTKVATTLAALTTWGPNHQFETVFSTTGPIENGVVQGDLIVQGGGDPFFVWEEAISVGNALNQAGIREVTGNLVVTGFFAMNFHDDPQASASALRQGMNASLWPAEAARQYQTLPSGTPRPQVIIRGDARLGPTTQAITPVLRHQSMPLVDLLKAMNVYSNNFMAQMIADGMGGAAAVSRQVTELTKIPPEEIQIINGSGLGEENRLSARAVTTMMIATQRYLQARQFTIADVYPILGQDGGTLKWREAPPGTVLKTGTLNEVSSLAGVFATQERGLVWFTIINLGSGDLEEFHNQQDSLLSQLQQTWGAADPISIQPTDRKKVGLNQLGTVKRNQLGKK